MILRRFLRSRRAHWPRVVVVTLLLAITLSSVNACATATDASMTLLSEFPCENVRIELYTGTSLAEARAKAVDPKTPPNAIVAASDADAASAGVRRCVVTDDDVAPNALINLGELTLVPKAGNARGAVVAVVERRDSPAEKFRVNRECARASEPSNELPDDNCLRVEAQFGYVAQSRVSFALQISSSCLSVNCGVDAVCDNGKCLKLPAEPPKLTGLDAGVTPEPAPVPGVTVTVPTGLPVTQTCYGGVVVGRANDKSVACPTGCIGDAGLVTCTPAPAVCEAPSNKERCCSTGANPMTQTCCLGAGVAFTAAAGPRFLPATPAGDACSAAGVLNACFAQGSVDCAAGEMCALRTAYGFGSCRPVPIACNKGNVVAGPGATKLACPLGQATCLTTAGTYTYPARSCSATASKCAIGKLTPCCTASATCCLQTVSGVNMPIASKTTCAAGAAACFADSDCAATKPAVGTRWGCLLDPALGWGRCGAK
jgi:hypothetical protein